MFNFSKLKRLFSFDRIVGYMTIAGSLAAIYGVERIYSLTVDLTPVIAIIQKKQNDNPKIIRDTITIIHKDTIIRKDTIVRRDTVLLKPVVVQSLPNLTSPSAPTKRDWVDYWNKIFREKHQLP